MAELNITLLDNLVYRVQDTGAGDISALLLECESDMERAILGWMHRIAGLWAKGENLDDDGFLECEGFIARCNKLDPSAREVELLWWLIFME